MELHFVWMHADSEACKVLFVQADLGSDMAAGEELSPVTMQLTCKRSACKGWRSLELAH